MKRILIIIALAAAAAALFLTPTQGKAGDDAERALTQIERELTGAIPKGDASVVERHYADAFTFTTPGGGVMTRADGNLPHVPPVKRRIPVRMVSTLPCNPLSPPCKQRVIFGEAQSTVNRANYHWRFAGTEFWIKSFDYVYAPNLYRLTQDGDPDLTWPQVKDELMRIFPNLPPNAYSNQEAKSRTNWMRAAGAFYADPDEVFVWLMDGQTQSSWPWAGRIIHLSWANANLNAEFGIPSTAFGHEMGHFFGLAHLDDDTIPTHPNPNDSYSKCDRWDQFFKDTNPPQFFSGPNSPGCNDGDVKLIGKKMDYRAQAPDAVPSLHFGNTSFSPGDWQIQGLVASAGVAHQPPTWGFAINAMGHFDKNIDTGISAPDPEELEKVDSHTPRFFSKSQLKIIDDFFTWNVEYKASSANIYKNGSNIPAGGLSNGLTSLRTKLGQSDDDFIWWSNAAMYPNFSFKSMTRDIGATDQTPVAGDFDCDGKSDLAWYRPSKGTLTLWWAAANRTFDVASAANIGSERIIFAGDFDGNSCTDLFLYGPGSASDTIYFGNPTRSWFTPPQTVNETGYQPFAADIEGDGDDDIIWYKPASGSADIWRGNGSTQPPTASGTTFTKTTGTHVGAGKFYTPIVGNFDGLEGDEILWYAGGPGVDPLWRSQQGAFAQSAMQIDGYYRPVAGDFNRDGRDDILWDNMMGLRAPIWEGVAGSQLFAHGAEAMMNADHRGVAGDFDGDGATDIFFYRSAIQKWADGFDYSGGWRTERHPRLLGDLNGDGKLDVVGFGNSGTEVALSSGYGLKPASRWVENFNYDNGWRVEKHLRYLADVDNDGDDDVVGFGNSGVYVAKSTGSGLGGVTRWIEEFHFDDNWLVERHPRVMADVNNDGKADIVGFGNNGVAVATSNGNAFGAAASWSTSFGYNDGWRVEKHPRLLADANGDGRADVIGFFDNGVMVSYSTGATFQAPALKVSNFGYTNGWRIEKHPRVMADVNGDGKSDIVGFANDGVLVSLSTGNNFAAPVFWSDFFGYDDSWRVETHPRFVEDVNGDGKADIVGFGNRTVYVAFSTGQGFTDPVEWIEEYTPERGGWSVGSHPRLVGDVTGDGRADIVGFGGSSGTSVTRSTLSFSAQ